MTIKIARGLAAGRQALLSQRALDEMAVSPQAMERIQEVFGEVLTPQQAVARIIADVRCEGDAALRDYTRRVDGVVLGDFQVGEVLSEMGSSPSTLRRGSGQAQPRWASSALRRPMRHYCATGDWPATYQRASRSTFREISRWTEVIVPCLNQH